LATFSAGSGFHMWRQNEDKFLFVHDAINFFNHDHGIAIIKKDNGYIETLSIAADTNNTQFSDTLIRELEFIGKFYNLVLSKQENIFQEININSILVPKEMLKMPEETVTDSFKLTPREKQILLLAANGSTAQEMAKTLNLSRRTIETYFQNLRRKYNCKNKAELIKLFFSQRLKSDSV
jgi:DNA-binding CsgD family transcriptional regulator